MTPFLYPFVPESCLYSTRPVAFRFLRLTHTPRRRCLNTTVRRQGVDFATSRTADVDGERSLNPTPDSYSLTPFADKCTLSLHAGEGGHGCVSFLREKFISEGPPNGGDGGTGGSIFIQAVRGETSLHKLARRGQLKAGRGRNGQGKLKGGERGEDVLITVPVGTVVRELWRRDPVDEDLERYREEKARKRALKESGEEVTPGEFKHEQWLLYPGASPSIFLKEIPKIPGPRRAPIAHMEPRGPLRLDLDKPMERPMLLVAGAVGGLGNPHFISRTTPRPQFASRGQDATRVGVQLELKLLADVGLVGLPNAGKSTLLRSLSNSRARVGNWAFTTLQPNIGTVVLDNHTGRPIIESKQRGVAPRENFTIADIPGLIENAHMDKGLGIKFLRHVERAAVLAFVVDLNAGDAVEALQALWREVGAYETLRGEELNAETQRILTDKFASSTGADIFGRDPDEEIELEPLALPPMSSKPWFVVATKADLDGTQENFAKLMAYLKEVQAGKAPHPSGKKNGWKKNINAVPVSAIQAHGVSKIPEVVVRLLEDAGL
ncbi:uncharacterized protein K452DRAFT_291054 [Aplosporella prunicola CBS 121167]|uniref:OBG-type G domain-containing protein n=1 Tax=Aplosporella prunicola CBS 121167 TaxID=1176127 RepID=A0A6A6B4Y8_9PEZI|nr:uncharacterized protein K452DRAFT_291054 [Aplosporella prunicola CBS 121167]KAF2138017.1 hypothetical protein K452DRAFT_291054 [Aplosporella prunicola CBS 121167]